MRNKLKLPPPCEKTREDFAELLAQCPNKIQFVFDSEKRKTDFGKDQTIETVNCKRSRLNIQLT